MRIKPIKTEADYEAALKEVERLFDANPGTAEADRLEVLTTLIEAYEGNHHAIPLPDPIEPILYYLESRGPRGGGLKQEMIPLLCESGRGSLRTWQLRRYGECEGLGWLSRPIFSWDFPGKT